MDTEPWSWGVTWHLWTIDISANLARVIRTGRQSRILCSSDRYPHLVTLSRSFLGFRQLVLHDAPDLLRGSRAMLVVTTENVVGHRVVELKGQCFGVVVRSRGLGGNVMARLRSIVGGEIHEYTHLLEDARRQAVDRLVQNATVMGANAVLMMRFDSSEIGQTMSEIVAYGTAAVIEPLPH